MSKLSVFILLVFIFALGFFALENKDTVTLKVPFSVTYEMPKVALILLASSFGALVVLMFFLVRDTRRAIENIQFHKKQKRDDKIKELYTKALNAILSHKEDVAIVALNDILKEDPDYADAFLRLGDIEFKRKSYTQALEYYKKARLIKPTDLQTLHSIEATLEALNRTDEALSLLDEIIDIDSANLTALYRKQALLEKKEQWDDLISLQKLILKYESDEPTKVVEQRKLLGYKYEYARASLETGHLEKAEKAFREIIKTDPKFLPAYLGSAEVLISQGENEQAINLLEKAYEELASTIIVARLEDLLISVGEPSRLIRFYKNAIAKRQDDHGLKFLLGKLYFRLEMVDDAVEMLDSIDTNLIAVPELYTLKGELYLKRNQLPQAVAEFRKACDIKKSLKIPYCCLNCGYSSVDWSGRCPRCKEWNTFGLDVYHACMTA